MSQTKIIETNICPTCGCSLVRLGISKEKASTASHNGQELYFCCDGCNELFKDSPDKYIEQTKDLIVCPTCLAEKPLFSATKLNLGGHDVYFCHCPHCVDLYKKNPEFYIDRLNGAISNEGVLDHDGCCISPD